MRTVLLFVVVSGAATSVSAASPSRLGGRANPNVPAMAMDQNPVPLPETVEVPKVVPSTQATTSPMTAPGCPAPNALFFPTGWVFPAKLPQAIFSYNTTAPVMAEVDADQKFLGRLVLPKGTRLVGAASTLHSDDRVNINWQLVVFPQGCEFPISAIALDKSDGAAGVKGDVQKHEDSVAAHIALKSALAASGAAAIAATPAGSLESSLATNFSSEAGQNVDKDLANVKSLESIYVHANIDIRVFVLRRFTRPAEGS